RSPTHPPPPVPPARLGSCWVRGGRPTRAHSTIAHYVAPVTHVRIPAACRQHGARTEVPGHARGAPPGLLRPVRSPVRGQWSQPAVTAGALRLSSTWSSRPYSLAASAERILSRSMSRSEARRVGQG